MRRFFSVWLILLVIVAFAVALLVSYPLLTARAEQTASDDLNVLLDAAFTRIALAESTAKTVADSEDENILGKARAVDRFLSHDDALLQTDALVVLCEMLNVSSVDVTDMDGNIVASSVAGRIGRSLTEDAKTAWTREVLEGENLSRTLVDESNAALLSGCVSRTDTEGLIYMQSLDVAILEAMTAATPEQVLLDMSFIKDTLAVADAEGNFGELTEESAYIVTREKDGVSLAAARPFTQVYAVRSAVLLVEAIGFLLCMLFAAVIQSMLIRKRLESRKGAPVVQDAAMEEAVQTGARTPEPTALMEDAPEETPQEEAAEPTTDAEAPEPQRRAGRRARKPRRKIFEFVDVEEAADVPDMKADGENGIARMDAEAGADAVETLAETLAAPLPEDAMALAEEAAAEFAAPEAVIEEPFAEESTEAPKKRRGRRRPAEDRAEAPVQDAIAEPVRKPRRKRGQEAPADADGAFDKIFD